MNSPDDAELSLTVAAAEWMDRVMGRSRPADLADRSGRTSLP